MKNLIFALTICLLTSGIINARDRALLIGVDAYQQRGVRPTPGSVADAVAMQNLLISKFNFSPNSITLLRNQEATAQNILRELEQLVSETQFGDRVFIHYSGHGFQVPDEYIIDEKDGLDEIIAPYNVEIRNVPNGVMKSTLTKGTYITDDIFNDYKVKLLGRSVVMVFDSCHSGTISRGLGDANNKNSRYLKLEENSRSITDNEIYSYIPKDSKSRDLFIAKDDNISDNKISGVVVISAASPYQEAFPVETESGLRGALSYIFEKAHSRNAPKLADLKTILVSEMKKFERDGKIGQAANGQFQVPEVEIFAVSADSPLFGTPITNASSPDRINASYSSAIQSALTNSGSKIQVKISIPNSVFSIGDKVTYSVETGEQGYLYVLVFSADKQAFCIFPATEQNPNSRIWEPVDIENYLAKGIHNFPRSKEVVSTVKKNYDTFAQEPIGKDVFVAILSKQKLPIGEKQNYTHNELFNALGLEKLQQEVWERTRGIGNKSSVKLTDNDWQAAILVVETVR